MIRRLALALVLPVLACDLLPFGGAKHDAGGAPTGAGGEAAPPPDAGDPTQGEPTDASPVDESVLSGMPGEGTAAPADGPNPPDEEATAVAAFVSQAGWGTDVDAGASFDESSALPAPTADGALALTRTPGTGHWRTGCGEPPLCFLRMAIMTASGRLYTARLGTTYPSDSCARDVVDDGKNILIGDPNGRFGDLRCTTASPQITVGFLIPNQVLGTTIERRWSAGDGFRSQWTIAHGAPVDNGLYVPAPSSTATLDLIWFGRFSKGEAYGSLVVPLRNKATGAAALGELIFDVRIR